MINQEAVKQRDFLKDLNKEQLEAVTTTEGYVRVLAGAGTGKTKALTYRFAHLVGNLQEPPGNILSVTFTNKAAGEMRQRIRSLIGDFDRGLICTFHGLCVRILREDANAINFPRNFAILDNSDAKAILRNVYEELGINSRELTFKKALDLIAVWKEKHQEEYIRALISLTNEELQREYLNATKTETRLCYAFLYEQRKSFGLDFDDLQYVGLYVLLTRKDIREKWQRRLEYIMVDEFQDIDPGQLKMIRILSAYHKNLFIVGDPDQTVYTWRGADVGLFLDFERRFPGTKTVIMDLNYRSTPQIISAANSLIEHNLNRIPKTLRPHLPPGSEVLCVSEKTPETEGRLIAAGILKLHAEDVEYKDIAVLYRAHYLSRTVEKALVEKNIPFIIHSGAPFYEREEIKDVLSYLRFLVTQDNIAFDRIINVPSRMIGRGRMAEIKKYAEERGCSHYEALRALLGHGAFRTPAVRYRAEDFIAMTEDLRRDSPQLKVSDILERVLLESGYEEMRRSEGDGERLENLAELKQAVVDFEQSYGEECTLESYLESVSLYVTGDGKVSSDAVNLMTIHAAKGLEFPQVFLCGMNEGVFPSDKSVTQAALEEERRLAFVALTRAERGLYITAPGGFDLARQRSRRPSRFLAELGEGVCYSPDLEPEEEGEPPGLVGTGTGATGEELVGRRIEVRGRGKGTVVEVHPAAATILVRFDGLGTCRSVRLDAELELLG